MSGSARFSHFCIGFLLLFSLAGTAQNDYDFYTTEAGDTPKSIARQFGITEQKLLKFNPELRGGSKPNLLLLIPKNNDLEIPKSKAHIVAEGETLYGIARIYGISLAEVRRYNPELDEALNVGDTLTIPLESKEEMQRREMRNDPNSQTGKEKTHTVQMGDTYYSLSKKYDVQVADLRTANSKQNEELRAGEILVIPNGTNTTKKKREKSSITLADSPKKEREEFSENESGFSAHNPSKKENNRTTNSTEFYEHLVQPRQTAYSLSKKYSLSLDSLFLLNPDSEEGLFVGQILKLPANRAPDFYHKREKKKRENAAAGDGYFLYKVKSGDTFYSLEREFGVPEKELVKLNPELANGLQVGKYIIIPEREKTEQLVVTEKLADEGMPNPLEEAEKNRERVPNPFYVEDSQSVADGFPKVLEDTLKLDLQRKLKVALMLPFGARRDTSVDYSRDIGRRAQLSLEFYNGFKMAADELAGHGMRLELDVVDTHNSLFLLKGKVRGLRAARYDLVVGPLTEESSEFVADVLKPEGVPVVSPLSRSVSVKGRENLIKCIPEAHNSARRLAGLINERFRGARLIFAQSRDTSANDEIKAIMAQLWPREDGSFADQAVYAQGSLSAGSLRDLLSPDKENVVVVLSENQVFLSNLVRQLRGRQRGRIFLLGPPRILEIATLEMDYLNELNLTMPDINFMDYQDTAMLHFIADYRERFGAEPTKFAYQGYDVGMYFLNKLWRAGPYFTLAIQGNQAMLSTGFELRKTADGGFENRFMHITGVRDFELVKVE